MAQYESKCVSSRLMKIAMDIDKFLRYVDIWYEETVVSLANAPPCSSSISTEDSVALAEADRSSSRCPCPPCFWDYEKENHGQARVIVASNSETKRRALHLEQKYQRKFRMSQKSTKSAPNSKYYKQLKKPPRMAFFPRRI